MGLLQKVVHLLKQIDPDNKGWERLQITAAKAQPSAPAREAALAAIKLAFARDNDDYGRKLYLIENCLYGVDIQPIAVQIAKLRFFIALIVDQKIVPKEKNFGILALPNLETKIVAANTLLGLKRGQLLLGSDKVRKLESELQQVRHDYFTARSYAEKKRLRETGQGTVRPAIRCAGFFRRIKFRRFAARHRLESLQRHSSRAVLRCWLDVWPAGQTGRWRV